MAGVVARSPKLSDIFGASWSFGQMSTVMRCKMSMVHEFELGMISMVDLKHKVREENRRSLIPEDLSVYPRPYISSYKLLIFFRPPFFSQVARKLIKHRPCLQKENIQATHDRALAMGDNDPLKPDYARFLRADKKSSFSNAVSLRHGHLENYSHWRETVRTKAVIKIQNIFRGKLARQVAENIAKKHAFLCARAMALEDTRQRIAAEIWKVKNLVYLSAIHFNECGLVRVVLSTRSSARLVCTQSYECLERSSIRSWTAQVGC